MTTHRESNTRSAPTGTRATSLSMKLCGVLRRGIAAGVVGVLLLAAGCASVGKGTGTGGNWVATWAAAPTGPASLASVPTFAPELTIANRTVRMVVRSSVAGRSVRIRLSNEIGESPAPVQVGAAHVALRDKGSAVVAATDRTLTFNGSRTVVIPSKGFVTSDPVTLETPALADMVVSLYLPDRTVA